MDGGKPWLQLYHPYSRFFLPQVSSQEGSWREERRGGEEVGGGGRGRRRKEGRKEGRRREVRVGEFEEDEGGTKTEGRWCGGKRETKTKRRRPEEDKEGRACRR
jgi:hypothetical protein